ncbi:MAG: hypothetical protein JWM87_4763 [Candidatus Eremiobacteraeota bacterium]|nr:hypothetical protein [Candidatus Eremiobacteraeota bacterium]
MKVAVALAAALIAVACTPAVAERGDVIAGRAPTAAEVAAESARVPLHVQTWLYYGLNGVNENVPPEVMARYADFVEDGDHGRFAARYKAAGGRYAAGYADPSYVPYCDPPFTPPAGRCKWEYSRYITDESGWFHGPDGSRVRRYVAGDRAYQEAVNPASPAAHRAWREFTRMVKARAPALDFLYSDDSGGPMLAGDMSPKSSQFYDFNEAGVEIRSNEAFRDAWIAYLAESALPLVLNGSDPDTARAAYGGAFLRQPFVRGSAHEGCFRYEGGVKTLRGDSWTNEGDAMLENARFHRWGLCFMTATPTVPKRMYAVASFWISYDPQWSLAVPVEAVPGQTSILPEFNIVPRFPLRTAVTHVSALRIDGGAFAREFGACFQGRRFIGACASVVNPSASTVPMPPLAASYRRTLVLSDGDAFHGSASWAPGVPAALAPGTAAILVR